jgi:hypothetical protein
MTIVPSVEIVFCDLGCIFRRIIYIQHQVVLNPGSMTLHVSNFETELPPIGVSCLLLHRSSHNTTKTVLLFNMCVLLSLFRLSW